MNAFHSQMDANRRQWDHLAPVHFRSDFYDVQGFLDGKLSLRDVELREVGDVKGKSLLHLQCHFGLDTLSWARLGADATGVDYSEEAIAIASRLSAEADAAARFICANVYDLPQHLSGTFDVVFASYGVLCWLPDIRRWAEIAASFLKPGGVFYLVESHPFVNVFDNAEGADDFEVVANYFHSAEPRRFEESGSYAAPADGRVLVSYEWTHSMGDVLDAILGAGLQIEFVHEFPFSSWRHFPFLECGQDGWWRLPRGRPQLPLVFSVKARKG